MAIYKSKNITKDGRQYFFRIKYKDILGDVKDYASKKYKTSKEAKEEEARFRIKVANMELNTSTISIRQVYLDYIEVKKTQVKKQTIRKENDLYKHLECIQDYRINDLNLNIYKKFTSHLDIENLSPIYKNKILGLFKRIINYSHRIYGTQLSILSFVDSYKNVNSFKKEMDFYTLEEYNRFSDSIQEPDWKLFFDILFFEGLRLGECLALTYKDIDLDKKEIHITKTLTTKIKGEKYTISTPKTKNSIRTLPMTERVYTSLLSIKNNMIKYRNFSEDWFIFGSVYPFPESSVCEKKNRICKNAGIRQIRLHDFRHSCASLLINQGASITLVSKYLGHSNITITLNTYTHLYKSELIEMTNILNNL